MLYVDDTFYDHEYFQRCFAAFEKHLILGRCQGKRIAVRLNDPAYWLALCLYTQKHQASVFPLPSDTPLEAARRRAERSKSHYLIFGEDGDTALENIECVGVYPDNSEAVLVQMSSGTTGEPKYIERTWQSIDVEITHYIDHFHSANAMQPVIACPINHSYGLICGVLVALKRGLVPIIVKNLNPKYIIRKMYETDAPLLYSSPTLIMTITMLVTADKPLHAVMTSGTIIQTKRFQAIAEKVTHLYQQYGCSETGCVALGGKITSATQLGKPLPHVTITAGNKVNDPGEIIIQIGQQPPVKTRDLGYFDRQGHLHFISRLDEVINVAGLNVYPNEVEEVILAMPQVQDAVVFKRTHDFGNDQVCLNYVSESVIPVKEIRAWCAQRLSSYQIPMRIAHVEEIKKLPNGKISRMALAETVQRQCREG